LGYKLLHGDGDEFIDEDFVVRQEELLAIAYLKSCRDNVIKRGFSFMGSFDGRHRCLARGDKVLMANGSWKAIENIKVSDSVISPQHDNTTIISKVIATHSHFEKEVYNVIEAKSKNRRLYTCSKDHKIPLIGSFTPRINKPGKKTKRNQLRRYKEYTAKHISKLRSATQSRVITFSTPQITFEQPDSSIKPYCLGLWLGDGHSSKIIRSNSYNLGITTNDKMIIEVIKSEYPNEVTGITKKTGTTAVTVRITTKGRFFSDLKRLNLIGTKSGTKFIPKECLLSSVRYRLKLLAGLIDTDGYISKKNCNIEITTKSENLASDILTLVCSLGGYGRITKIKKGIKSTGFIGQYYVVRFAFKTFSIMRILDEINIKMKKERLLHQIYRYERTNRNHANYDPRHTSIKCVRTFPQIVCGFTLDSPSGLFVTNDYLVTHNSGKSITAATFGYLWDSTFWKYFENRVVQDHKEFVDSVDKLSKGNIKGGVIMVDEAGIVMSSSDWYEKWMKTITQMVQMFGYLCPVVLFVAPVKDFVDSRLRKMFHAYFKIDRYGMEETTVTPYALKYNTINNKWFYKKPVIDINGQHITLRRLKISKPPDFLLERYRNLELQRKSVMFEKFVDDIRRAEVKETKKELDLDKVISKVIENCTIYESKRSKPTDIILDQTKIEFGWRTTNRVARYIKNEAERKIRDKQRKISEAIENKKEANK